MRKNDIILIVAAIIFIVVLSVVSYVHTIKVFTDDSWYDSEHEPSLGATVDMTEKTIESEPVEIGNKLDVIIADDEPVYNYDFLFMNEKSADAVDDLLGYVRRLDIKALKTDFDGLTMILGMKVCDIIGDSDWYTNRETDVLQSGEASYVVLSNDYWNEFCCVDDPNVDNGEVIVWVHNYEDEPQQIRDCVVYKYKLNFQNNSELYTQRPELAFADKYYIGYNGDFSRYDEKNSFIIDNVTCERYTYGTVDDCQVLLDVDETGLFAITVHCNEYYGPDFMIGGDDCE